MRLDEGFTVSSVIAGKPSRYWQQRGLSELNAMRWPDDVPVNRKPTQEGAGESNKRELELRNHANVPSPGVDSGDDGERADDDGQHGDEILNDKPFEPIRCGRHQVVTLNREIAQ